MGNHKRKFILLFVLCFSSFVACSNSSQQNDIYADFSPIEISTSNTCESSETTVEPDFHECSVSISDDGRYQLEYDGISFNANVVGPDADEVAVYSVVTANYDDEHGRIVDYYDVNNYEGVTFNWNSLTFSNYYAFPDDNTVDINREFIESLSVIEELPDNVILAEEMFEDYVPNVSVAPYALSYYYRNDTIYGNYSCSNMSNEPFIFDSDFNEVIFRDSINGLPIGVAYESYRSVFNICYMLSDELIAGSIVNNNNGYTVYDGESVITMIDCEVVDCVQCSAAYPLFDISDSIINSIPVFLNLQQRFNVTTMDVYFIELIYVEFRNNISIFPDESDEYYLIPVWAMYFQGGTYSERPCRGAVYVDAINGVAY